MKSYSKSLSIEAKKISKLMAEINKIENYRRECRRTDEYDSYSRDIAAKLFELSMVASSFSHTASIYEHCEVESIMDRK